MAQRDGVDLIIEQWRRERPDLDHSPIGVVGRLSRLAREIEQRLEPVYREHGLEPGWHDVLATLRRSGSPLHLGWVPLYARDTEAIESASGELGLVRRTLPGVVEATGRHWLKPLKARYLQARGRRRLRRDEA